MDSRRSNIIRDCADHLALTLGELMSISATAPRRYYVWEIPKKSGNGTRTVCHPARELKPVQKFFLHHVINDLPVHRAATAYVTGSSIKKNANAHVHSRVILKLDFADFFNSLKVENWRKYVADHLPHWSEDEIDFSCRILFWGVRSYDPRCLAIGAPTSPQLSNALMYEIDERLYAYAQSSSLNYTRYADDITFSSQDKIDRGATIRAVTQALREAKYTSVRLNEGKTILVSDRFARRVTGLVITPDNKISLGRERKRLIRAMVHHAECRKLPAEDWPRLAGLLAFAKDVEPAFVGRLCQKYSLDLIARILRHRL